mmetsp:Transcript_4342/g.15247  ORF Transcript_4342/g.15247 Transcript_4342/m.15247 type:complete len:221 (+) Transcript_4342:2019-2681(+)
MAELCLLHPERVEERELFREGVVPERRGVLARPGQGFRDGLHLQGVQISCKGLDQGIQRELEGVCHCVHVGEGGFGLPAKGVHAQHPGHHPAPLGHPAGLLAGGLGELGLERGKKHVQGDHGDEDVQKGGLLGVPLAHPEGVLLSAGLGERRDRPGAPREGRLVVPDARCDGPDVSGGQESPVLLCLLPREGGPGHRPARLRLGSGAPRGRIHKGPPQQL